MSDESYVPPTRERLVELGDELFVMGRGDDGSTFTALAGPDVASRVLAAFGTARHAVETGKSAIDLYMNGRELVALTLVRASFEAAITSLWLVQNPEAIRGFVGEEHRQRRALSLSMAEAASESLRTGADRIAHLNESDIDTVAKNSARFFKERCNELNGGKDAYTHYRILSGMVHPSATLADFYLEADDSATMGCSLHYEPRQVGHDSWLFLTVASMTWANRALDHLDTGRAHRSRLRSIARELGIPETLGLTMEAQMAAKRKKRGQRPRSQA